MGHGAPSGYPMPDATFLKISGAKLEKQSLISHYGGVLAFKWQKQHFFQGLRVFNFVFVPNPDVEPVEDHAERGTCERLRNFSPLFRFIQIGES